MRKTHVLIDSIRLDLKTKLSTKPTKHKTFAREQKLHKKISL